MNYDGITLDDYFLTYYLPFINAIDSGQRTDVGHTDVRVEAANLGPYGMTVGLVHTIADLTRRYLRRELTEYSERIQDALGEEAHFLDNMFADGTILETNWSEEMRAPDEWIE
ncbi:hypothetical protein A5666_16815 [Mycolicibacterium fortuitum]|nr:hypothetical protein A5665_07280 [Mycolicibacterium fortuitum]OBI59947.1 hypothetical protein A5666_16815 [Mycolicibacterium fortuitum]